MLLRVGVRPHPTGLCKQGKERVTNECHHSKKVDVMNSICLKISLLVLLSVMGETASFPPAHLPFPLSSLGGCERLEVTFMPVSLEHAYRRESLQQGYSQLLQLGLLLIGGCEDAGQQNILTILFLSVTKLYFIPPSTHWPLFTQPDW